MAIPANAAAGAALHGATVQSDAIVIEAHGGTAFVPGPPGFIVGADYARSGWDLKLADKDGHEAVIKDFFKLEHPPELVSPEGAHISADLAMKLAGPLAPGQYAQAAPGAGSVPIGQVQTVQGAATVTHTDGTKVALAVGTPIFQGDILETGANGALGVVFVDKTTFAMQDDSRMVIDRLIFDPGSKQGSQVFSLLQGAFVAVTGEIAQTNPQAVTINTPVAAIGIRGTEFAVLISQQLGQTLFTLLAGAISISNALGQVVLNTAGLTTLATNFNAPPAPPFALPQAQFNTLYGQGAAITEQLRPFSVRPQQQQQQQNQNQNQNELQQVQNIEPGAGPDQQGQPGANKTFGATNIFGGVPGLGTTQLALGFVLGVGGDPFKYGAPSSFTFSGEPGSDRNRPIVQIQEPPPGTTGTQTIEIQPGGNPNEALVVGTTTLTVANPDTIPTIVGSSGNDTLIVQDLSNTVFANATITFLGNGGNDVLNAQAAVNPIVADGGAGNDTLNSGSGNDLLAGGTGADVVNGGAGNDVIIWNAGDGSDTIIGGPGTDQLLLNADPAVGTTFTIGPDTAGTFTVTSGPDTLNVEGVEQIVVVGGSGNDVLNAADTSHTVAAAGGDGNDTLTTGSGNDVLDGGAGNDVLTAGSGNDLLDGAAGDDTLAGGDGVDTASYASTTTAVAVDLSAGTAVGSESGSDQLSGIENVLGGGGNDTLTGNAAANLLVGGAGNDTFNGGAGNDQLVGGPGIDTVSYAGTTSGVTVNLAAGTNVLTDATDGAAAKTTINVTAGDVITFSWSFDAGDYIPFGDYAFVVINGEVQKLAGIADTGNYNALPWQTFTFTATSTGPLVLGFGVVNTGDQLLDSFLIIDKLAVNGVVVDSFEAGLPGWTTQGAVTVVASHDNPDAQFPSTYLPTDGNSLLQIQSQPASQATLEAFLGAAAGVLDTLADAGTGSATGAESGTDQLSSIENVIGGAGNDSITGDGLNNVLDGAAGNDTIIGGGGADTIIGALGDDAMSGGTGDDTFLWHPGDSSASTDSVNGDAGQDQVIVDGSGTAGLNVEISTGHFIAFDGETASAVDFQNIESLVFQGTAFDDLLRFTDAAGADVTFAGGDGWDTVAAVVENDIFTVTGDPQSVTVTGGATQNVFGTSVEELHFEVAAGTASITLNGLEDTGLSLVTFDGSASTQSFVDGANGGIVMEAVGGSGNDTLIGGVANDTLSGGDGTDRLVGGSGSDTLEGGAGADIYHYDDPGNIAGAQNGDGFIITTNRVKAADENGDFIVGFQSGVDKIEFGPNIAFEDGFFSVIAGPYDGTNPGDNEEWAEGHPTLIYSQADKTLYYDANGAAAGYQVVATVQSGDHIQATDVTATVGT